MKKQIYKFILYGKKKAWRFKFVAPNGNIMFHSEAYKNKMAVRKSVDSIKRNVWKSIVEEDW